MSRLLTPKFLLRGFEISVLASMVGFGITLLYGNDLPAFLRGLGRVHLGWVAAGIVLASLDWIAGGLRLWICARHVIPRPSLKGSILAGGMGAWAGFITPLNSGAGPMTMYTLRRYGIPLPVGIAATFMSFVSTVLFFALAGPLAVTFGAGKSLGQRGNVLGLSLLDLFKGSLTIVAGLGVRAAHREGAGGDRYHVERDVGAGDGLLVSGVFDRGGGTAGGRVRKQGDRAGNEKAHGKQ